MEWLTPSDHFATQAGFWLGVVGVVLSVGGFGIAWWQLRKTRSAVEAAAAAILRTRQRSQHGELLQLFERLFNAETELRAAVAANQAETATAAAHRWRLAAAEARAIARDFRPDWTDLSEALADAITEVAGIPRPTKSRRGAGLAGHYDSAIRSIGEATALIAGHRPSLRTYDDTDGTDSTPP